MIWHSLIVFPSLAHAGHYLVSLLYLLPVVVLGVGVAWQRHKERQESKAAASEEAPASAEPNRPL